MSRLPVDLTVYPVAQRWKGHPLRVQVIDQGTVPLRITTNTVALHGKCVITSAPQVKVSPAAFDLMPGKFQFTTVTAPAMKGDWGVVYSATANGKGAVHLGTAIGSQILSGGAANCVPPLHKQHLALAHTSGFPLPFVLAGILAVFLVIGGLWLWRFRSV